MKINACNKVVLSTLGLTDADHVLYITYSAIERFSFECRKVIGFTLCTPHDWLRKLVPLFHPIRSKTKPNRASLARVFPRFASATCNYFEF